MLIAVEKRILLLSVEAGTVDASLNCLVCLQAGIREYDNQSLGIFVSERDGSLLLSDQLR
jgi:hypothetical protein